MQFNLSARPKATPDDALAIDEDSFLALVADDM
jgi:hypothetical protein